MLGVGALEGTPDSTLIVPLPFSGEDPSQSIA